MANLSEAILMGTTANRPAAGSKGRLFLDTQLQSIFYDTGTVWDLFRGGSSSLIYSQYAGPTINNDDFSTSVFDDTQAFGSRTIPGGTIQAGDTLRAHVWGTLTVTAPNDGWSAVIENYPTLVMTGDGGGPLLENTTINQVGWSIELTLIAREAGSPGFYCHGRLHVINGFESGDHSTEEKRWEMWGTSLNLNGKTWADDFTLNIRLSNSSGDNNTWTVSGATIEFLKLASFE